MMNDEFCKNLIINYLQKQKTAIIFIQLFTMQGGWAFFELSS